MRRHWNSKGRIIFRSKLFALSSLLFALCLILPDRASSGPYLNSAHGNYTPLLLATECFVPLSPLHLMTMAEETVSTASKQHVSIGGAEPVPTGGPDKYELFASLFTDQATMFCYQCHTDTTPQQQTLPAQYNYSRIAGGDTNTCPNDIKEAFQFVNTTGSSQLNCGSSYGSSHFLADIQTFLTNKWNFGSTTAEINPCSGCHNPHRAQRDPIQLLQGAGPFPGQASIVRTTMSGVYGGMMLQLRG